MKTLTRKKRGLISQSPHRKFLLKVASTVRDTLVFQISKKEIVKQIEYHYGVDVFWVIDDFHRKDPLINQIKGKKLFIKASEKNKTLAQSQLVWSWLSSSGAGRYSVLVVLGGGLLLDLGGFVGALYFRGIKIVFVPTTLLSMADSCIGGKNGVNCQGAKNQIGVYYAPTEVYISLEWLKSLPQEQWTSGWGEIIKTCYIARRVDRLKSLTSCMADQKIMDWVLFSLKTKAKILAQDEFDMSKRITLNFGHTFGHAIEAALNGAVPHGVAVYYGMSISLGYSLKKGILCEQDFNIFTKLESTLGFSKFKKGVQKVFSQTKLYQRYIDALLKDKKRLKKNEFLILVYSSQDGIKKMQIDFKELASFSDAF